MLEQKRIDIRREIIANNIKVIIPTFRELYCKTIIKDGMDIREFFDNIEKGDMRCFRFLYSPEFTDAIAEENGLSLLKKNRDELLRVYSRPIVEHTLLAINMRLQKYEIADSVGREDLDSLFSAYLGKEIIEELRLKHNPFENPEKLVEGRREDVEQGGLPVSIVHDEIKNFLDSDVLTVFEFPYSSLLDEIKSDFLENMLKLY